jgi:hypothetical protein
LIDKPKATLSGALQKEGRRRVRISFRAWRAAERGLATRLFSQICGNSHFAFLLARHDHLDVELVGHLRYLQENTDEPNSLRRIYAG